MVTSINTARTGPDQTWKLPDGCGREDDLASGSLPAPDTCGGPGRVDGGRAWLLVQREEPAQPVLRLGLAPVLAVLPPGALLPPEALLLVGPPQPLMLVVLRQVLGARPGPVLSPPANERPHYRQEATPGQHGNHVRPTGCSRPPDGALCIHETKAPGAHLG